jgi:hypothetical protein
VSVDEEWVRDILADHACLVHIHVIDVVHEIDAFALARVCWLDDPNVLLAFVLLELLVMIVEITELIRKNVSVRNKIKCALAVPFLHAHDVEAQSVFACDLMTLRELVNLLVLVQTLVLIGLARA